jgi:hypothetical protein
MKQKILLAAAVPLAALALAACASDTEGREAEEPERPASTAAAEPAEPPATTTEPAPEPITAEEQAWLAAVRSYSRSLQRVVRRPGAITHTTMRRSARAYLGCTRTLERAGDAGRLEPARVLAARACARLERAAGFLEQAIAASGPGGIVYAGTADEERFNRALGNAFEAAGTAQSDLQRALGRAEEIQRTLDS